MTTSTPQEMNVPEINVDRFGQIRWINGTNQFHCLPILRKCADLPGTAVTTLFKSDDLTRRLERQIRLTNDPSSSIPSYIPIYQFKLTEQDRMFSQYSQGPRQFFETKMMDRIYRPFATQVLETAKRAHSDPSFQANMDPSMEFIHPFANTIDSYPPNVIYTFGAIGLEGQLIQNVPARIINSQKNMALAEAINGKFPIIITADCRIISTRNYQLKQLRPTSMMDFLPTESNATFTIRMITPYLAHAVSYEYGDSYADGIQIGTVVSYDPEEIRIAVRIHTLNYKSVLWTLLPPGLHPDDILERDVVVRTKDLKIIAIALIEPSLSRIPEARVWIRLQSKPYDKSLKDCDFVNAVTLHPTASQSFTRPAFVDVQLPLTMLPYWMDPKREIEFKQDPIEMQAKLNGMTMVIDLEPMDHNNVIYTPRNDAMPKAGQFLNFPTKMFTNSESEQLWHQTRVIQPSKQVTLRLDTMAAKTVGLRRFLRSIAQRMPEIPDPFEYGLLSVAAIKEKFEQRKNLCSERLCRMTVEKRKEVEGRLEKVGERVKLMVDPLAPETVLNEVIRIYHQAKEIEESPSKPAQFQRQIFHYPNPLIQAVAENVRRNYKDEGKTSNRKSQSSSETSDSEKKSETISEERLDESTVKETSSETSRNSDMEVTAHGTGLLKVKKKDGDIRTCVKQKKITRFQETSFSTKESEENTPKTDLNPIVTETQNQPLTITIEKPKETWGEAIHPYHQSKVISGQQTVSQAVATKATLVEVPSLKTLATKKIVSLIATAVTKLTDNPSPEIFTEQPIVSSIAAVQADLTSNQLPVISVAYSYAQQFVAKNTAAINGLVRFAKLYIKQRPHPFLDKCDPILSTIKRDRQLNRGQAVKYFSTAQAVAIIHIGVMSKGTVIEASDFFTALQNFSCSTNQCDNHNLAEVRLTTTENQHCESQCLPTEMTTLWTIAVGTNPWTTAERTAKLVRDSDIFAFGYGIDPKIPDPMETTNRLSAWQRGSFYGKLPLKEFHTTENNKELIQLDESIQVVKYSQGLVYHLELTNAALKTVMKKWNFLTFHHGNIVDLENSEEVVQIHHGAGEIATIEFHQWFNTNFELCCAIVQLSWIKGIELTPFQVERAVSWLLEHAMMFRMSLDTSETPITPMDMMTPLDAKFYTLAGNSHCNRARRTILLRGCSPYVYNLPRNHEMILMDEKPEGFRDRLRQSLTLTEHRIRLQLENHHLYEKLALDKLSNPELASPKFQKKLQKWNCFPLSKPFVPELQLPEEVEECTLQLLVPLGQPYVSDIFEHALTTVRNSDQKTHYFHPELKKPMGLLINPSANDQMKTSRSSSRDRRDAIELRVSLMSPYSSFGNSDDRISENEFEDFNPSPKSEPEEEMDSFPPKIFKVADSPVLSPTLNKDNFSEISDENHPFRPTITTFGLNRDEETNYPIIRSNPHSRTSDSSDSDSWESNGRFYATSNVNHPRELLREYEFPSVQYEIDGHLMIGVEKLRRYQKHTAQYVIWNRKNHMGVTMAPAEYCGWLQNSHPSRREYTMMNYGIPIRIDQRDPFFRPPWLTYSIFNGKPQPSTSSIAIFQENGKPRTLRYPFSLAWTGHRFQEYVADQPNFMCNVETERLGYEPEIVMWCTKTHLGTIMTQEQFYNFQVMCVAHEELPFQPPIHVFGRTITTKDREPLFCPPWENPNVFSGLLIMTTKLLQDFTVPYEVSLIAQQAGPQWYVGLEMPSHFEPNYLPKRIVWHVLTYTGYVLTGPQFQKWMAFNRILQPKIHSRYKPEQSEISDSCLTFSTPHPIPMDCPFPSENIKFFGQKVELTNPQHPFEPDPLLINNPFFRPPWRSYLGFNGQPPPPPRGPFQRDRLLLMNRPSNPNSVIDLHFMRQFPKLITTGLRAFEFRKRHLKDEVVIWDHIHRIGYVMNQRDFDRFDNAQGDQEEIRRISRNSIRIVTRQEIESGELLYIPPWYFANHPALQDESRIDVKEIANPIEMNTDEIPFQNPCSHWNTRIDGFSHRNKRRKDDRRRNQIPVACATHDLRDACAFIELNNPSSPCFDAKLYARRYVYMEQNAGARMWNPIVMYQQQWKKLPLESIPKTPYTVFSTEYNSRDYRVYPQLEAILNFGPPWTLSMPHMQPQSEGHLMTHLARSLLTHPQKAHPYINRIYTESGRQIFTKNGHQHYLIDPIQSITEMNDQPVQPYSGFKIQNDPVELIKDETKFRNGSESEIPQLPISWKVDFAKNFGFGPLENQSMNQNRQDITDRQPIRLVIARSHSIKTDFVEYANKVLRNSRQEFLHGIEHPLLNPKPILTEHIYEPLKPFGIEPADSENRTNESRRNPKRTSPRSSLRETNRHIENRMKQRRTVTNWSRQYCDESTELFNDVSDNEISTPIPLPVDLDANLDVDLDVTGISDECLDCAVIPKEENTDFSLLKTEETTSVVQPPVPEKIYFNYNGRNVTNLRKVPSSAPMPIQKQKFHYCEYSF
jgi:hypothetical protein